MAFNAQRFNSAAFTEGVWQEIMGGNFLVAKAGNPVYEKALEDSGYRKARTPEAKEKALYTAVVKGILLDWSDVTDANGEDIPYNTANAITVLAENPDLVNEVLERANDLDAFKREDTADQLGKQQAG